MTDIKRYGDSGIHTVEGTVSGATALALSKEREKQVKEYEEKKRLIKEANAGGLGRLDDKFSTNEISFEQNSYGLLTADELKKLKEIKNQITKEENESLRKQKEKDDEQKKIIKEQKRKKLQASLSFGDEDFDDNIDDTMGLSKKKTKKNPEVDTSYLPDAERDRALEEKKEKLRLEWLEQQEIIKNELLEVGKILLRFILILILVIVFITFHFYYDVFRLFIL